MQIAVKTRCDLCQSMACASGAIRYHYTKNLRPRAKPRAGIQFQPGHLAIWPGCAGLYWQARCGGSPGSARIRPTQRRHKLAQSKGQIYRSGSKFRQGGGGLGWGPLQVSIYNAGMLHENPRREQFYKQSKNRAKHNSNLNQSSCFRGRPGACCPD